MSFDPKIHHRRSIRLKDYDYSKSGIYFITICAEDKKCLFGKIINDELILNDAGMMIKNEWETLLKRFLNIELGDLVIMLNHLHGIIIINNECDDVDFVGAVPCACPVRIQTGHPQGDAPTDVGAKQATVGEIVGAFKSITTNKYINGVKQNNWPEFNKRIWQRNYYEHIVRSEESLNEIRKYIMCNQYKWRDDALYVNNQN